MAPTPTNRSVDRSLRASCSIQAAHRQMRWQSQSACSSVAPPNATTESPNHVHSKKNFAGESACGERAQDSTDNLNSGEGDTPQTAAHVSRCPLRPRPPHPIHHVARTETPSPRKRCEGAITTSAPKIRAVRRGLPYAHATTLRHAKH